MTALEITGTGGSAVLENEYRIREFLSVEGIPVTKNDGSVTEEMNLLPSAYFICNGVFENGKTEGLSAPGRRLRPRCGNESERGQASGGAGVWLAGNPELFLSEYYPEQIE